MRWDLLTIAFIAFFIYVTSYMIIFRRFKKYLIGKIREPVFPLPFPLPNFCKISTQEIFSTAWRLGKFLDKILAVIHILSLLIIFITHLITKRF